MGLIDIFNLLTALITQSDAVTPSCTDQEVEEKTLTRASTTKPKRAGGTRLGLMQ